ncbi:DUF1877 family protein [Janibacter limosus]|uniref:DUF1877 family protein n=1 Tax=Janibacter limosus TaxID=53458 RepID=A0A4P6MVB2_9MICO|nr:DUF1877 family protein [Janibacter limosus]QBF46852.1 DUF1877 family protein [Janibacter limosus]
MGIRYYAFAFDRDQTEQALSDPDNIMSDDPLADAWGLVPRRAMASTITGVQTLPQRDMLYLDKAWRHLQVLTGQLDDSAARPAYRMFEGEVTWTERGHRRWVRTLRPGDIPEIAHDLSAIGADELARLPELGFGHRDPQEEISYVGHFLGRARAFMTTLAEDGRGMVYTIG